VRHRERGATGAYASDALAVLDLGNLWQARRDLVAMIRRDTLEPANGDGLALHPAAPARRLARPVADAAENAGKHVGMPVHQVRIGEAPLCDQPDVLGNIRV